MTINLEQGITQMTYQAQTIRSMIVGVDDAQARWKPNAESWSILEVMNHLYDEEREDFRVRLDIILHRPNDAWPLIRPAEWVTERQYQQRDLADSLQNFLAEREKSLDWLRSLKDPDWQATSPRPRGGTIRAGDMFAAWVAHDLLHVRQLVELHYAYTVERNQPFLVDYAGGW
jgi:hypothetical protein